MATNFQTPTDLSGHTIDTGQSITTRTGSAGPISHANIDSNWNRLTTKVNGIHAGLSAVHTAINALEGSSLFSDGLPAATVSTRGGVRIGGGLSISGDVLSANPASIDAQIDAKIESQVQADDAISISALRTTWTWLDSPHTLTFSKDDYGVNSNRKLAGTSTSYRPINWRFIPVAGLYGVSGSATQVLCHVTGGQCSLYARCPYFTTTYERVMWAADNENVGANLILSIGANAFPYASHHGGDHVTLGRPSPDPLPVHGSTVKSVVTPSHDPYGVGVRGMSPSDCITVCPVNQNNGDSELHEITIFAYR